jgi:L-aminopeptidase/D-esterase-like protein
MPAITDVAGLKVGQVSDPAGVTGCSVLLGPFRAVCDIRGLATGSRELETLSPVHVTPACDALLLTGGSAFGLAAAQGVVQWLEEQGLGYQAGAARVPIVPAAVIFDLGAAGRVRPSPEMGRAACEAATASPPAEGRVGAGTGASIGKLRGIQNAEPGGVGTWSAQVAGFEIGAFVVVNALGDVLGRDGRVLAGARGPDGQHVDSATDLLRPGALESLARARMPQPGTNTTLAVVATDAPLSRTALQVVARAASAGMARRISPVNTPFDGDITFALSTAQEVRELTSPELLLLGVAAAHVLEEAILRAASEAMRKS